MSSQTEIIKHPKKQSIKSKNQQKQQIAESDPQRLHLKK